MRTPNGLLPRLAPAVVLALTALAAAAAAQPPAKLAPAPLESGCGPGIKDAESDRMVELLLADRWAALEAELDRYQKAYEREVGCEPRLWIAFHNLVLTRPKRMARLDRWVAARPRSYVAHSLRGIGLKDMGYKLRGTGLSKDTSAEQFAAMREAHVRARQDLETAIAINPRHVVAYGVIIELLKASGGQDEALTVLARLLAVDPINYGARRRMLETLSPRWGGSLKTMEEVAMEAQSQVDRNPRLRVLMGFPHAWRGHVARFQTKEREEAVGHYTRALEYGEYSAWRRARTELRFEVREYEGAVADADIYLRENPGSSTGLLNRGRAYAKLGRLDEALRDLDQVVKQSPRRADGYRSRAWMHAGAGHWEAAKSDYRKALELKPGDRWARRKLAELEARRPQGTLPGLSHMME